MCHDCATKSLSVFEKFSGSCKNQNGPAIFKLQAHSSFKRYFLSPQGDILMISISLKLLCGERGIRTPGPVTVNSFQDCRNRPLCHFSGAKV